MNGIVTVNIGIFSKRGSMQEVADNLICLQMAQKIIFHSKTYHSWLIVLSFWSPFRIAALLVLRCSLNNTKTFIMVDLVEST